MIIFIIVAMERAALGNSIVPCPLTTFFPTESYSNLLRRPFQFSSATISFPLSVRNSEATDTKQL